MSLKGHLYKVVIPL